MSPEQHARAKELFGKAQGLKRSQVEDFLMAECPDDDEVRAEVISLLEFDHPETILLESQKDPASEAQVPSPLPHASTVHRMAGRFRRKENRLKLWAVLAFLGIVSLGTLTYRHVLSATDQMLRSQIESLLNSTVSALEILFREERDRLDSWVQIPTLVDASEEILNVGRQDNYSESALSASPAQKRIHEILDPLVGRKEYLGFALLSPSGHFLAGTNDLFRDRIGKLVKEPASRFLSPVLQAPKGKSGAQLVRPLPPGQGTRAGAAAAAELLPLNFLTVWAKLARYTPETQEEKIFGLLVLLIRPEVDFSRLLVGARVGETGETYAFDADGNLLSESRFVGDLAALGLLPERPEGKKPTAIFTVKIHDPGRALSPSSPLEEKVEGLPRTKMLRLAVGKKNEKGRSSLETYRDYRGQEVVGAWIWLKRYGFGLATEIDQAEAFAPVFWVRWAFLLLFGLLLAALVFVLTTSFSVLRMEKNIDEAKQIGPYVLEKKIGEGGIGEVYLAKHALLRRPTAIKLLKKHSFNDETLKRFEVEVRETSRLTHPNTVEIYDYGHTPVGTFYYAMEYLPGLTMADLIKQEGPIEPRRVVHLLDQACASLSEAHSKGLIHRDIKPQNIMLCERGGIYDTVKVLDFGLVKNVDASQDVQHTAPDQLGGTPMYIAPERIRDPSQNSALTDLYAVGTVAFNLLTGRNPFDAGTSVEIVYQVMQKEAPMVNDIAGIQVPDALNRLVASLMSKLPEDRPQSADQLRLDLAALDLPAWTFEDARAWWQKHEAASSS